MGEDEELGGEEWHALFRSRKVGNLGEKSEAAAGMRIEALLGAECSFGNDSYCDAGLYPLRLEICCWEMIAELSSPAAKSSW